MTGPDHYRHAEELLDMASGEDFDDKAERSRHAAAQVHATLALAAATALMQPFAGKYPLAEYGGWVEVAAEPEASAAGAGGDETR